MSNRNNVWEDAQVISRYTREQAIADGMLIDVSAVAREAGITFPTVVTANVWSQCVKWTGDGSQDESGRLWDVVWMLRVAIRAQPKGVPIDRIRYRVLVRNEQTNKLQKKELTSVCGPGDEGEPVITIMFPEYD